MPAERQGPVAGVVLAAGASTRMGQSKLLLELDGVTMIRHVVGRAACAGLEPVLVVLGFESDLVAPELAGIRCSVVVNPEYERGMNNSFRFGIGQVPDESIAALVMLGDMPFVTAAMLRELVRRFRGTNAPVVLSRYGHVAAPPTLFDRSLFSEFGASEGEGCGKEVVTRLRDQALAVDWPASALIDLDVPHDYERIKTLLAAGP